MGESAAPICVEGAISPGPSPIRRMTRFEYNNTVRDLLGDITEPARDLPVEEEALGFSNNAKALVVTPVLAEKYMIVAEGISGRATMDVGGLTGCDPSATGAMRDGCVKAFIASFGKRAFRRPLTDEERAELFALFETGVAFESNRAEPPQTGFRTGIQMMIEATLQSPHFLYRVELGAGPVPGAEQDAVKLTSWEMASRLSYFLWGSMPDDELFAAAEAGHLDTKDEIAAQARRMLGEPTAREAISVFHEQWLDYDRISNVGKDAVRFPEWSTAIGALMKEEMHTFIDHVIFDGEGDFGTLLTAPYSFGDADLASFYGGGATTSGSGASLSRMDFAPEKHAGLLSMGAILAYYAHSDQTSPVLRGKLVREVFLCDTLAPPPANFQPPMPDPNSTGRERAAEHAQSGCADCHRLMDPLGFGFESFDATGRWRATENGEPIDSSGEIVDSDIDGKFDGVRDLATRLASSQEVESCYARMWFRYAYGRGETQTDMCSIDRIETAFSDSGGNVKELLVALTQTDAFLYRRPGSTVPGGQ